MVCLRHWSSISSLYRIPLRSSYMVFSVPSTSLLRSSTYWLRVSERIFFKSTVITYRAIHGTEPINLQFCFIRVADIPLRRRLHSSCYDRLHVPLVRLSTVGSRTFPVSGAAVCNDLSAHVTSAPSLAVFRQRLKTFLVFLSWHRYLIYKLSVFNTCVDLAITVLFRPR